MIPQPSTGSSSAAGGGFEDTLGTNRGEWLLLDRTLISADGAPAREPSSSQSRTALQL
jgi:hypothetical protein